MKARGGARHRPRWRCSRRSTGTSRMSWFCERPLLRLDPLPHVLDGQPGAELAGVVPLVPLDLPGKRLGLALELFEDVAHAVLRRLDVLVALDRVAPAQPGLDLAVLVVSDPRELRRRDVLELRD